MSLFGRCSNNAITPKKIVWMALNFPLFLSLPLRSTLFPFVPLCSTLFPFVQLPSSPFPLPSIAPLIILVSGNEQTSPATYK